MALTADQITAQNFKDFYGQIRPYLNGQVPTFANQFSRSDLYSTSEKIIGCWTDGKPIYSRTFQGTFSSVETIVTDSINSTNNELIHAFGNLYNSVGSAYHIGYSDASANSRHSGFILIPGGLRVDATGSAASGWVGQPFVVTAHYTKKSDSAIKVGTGTDYSTDEQIIGTWIDGKPIYQRTYNFTLPVIYDGTENGCDVVTLENTKIINVVGYISGNNQTSYPLTFTTVSSGETRFVNCFKNGSGIVKIKTNLGTISEKSGYVTLRYVKTID